MEQARQRWWEGRCSMVGPGGAQAQGGRFLPDSAIEWLYEGEGAPLSICSQRARALRDAAEERGLEATLVAQTRTRAGAVVRAEVSGDGVSGWGGSGAPGAVCGRCGRVLRSRASIMRGYGPMCWEASSS